MDLLVERNSYFWGNDEIEKIVFYVYVYNERSWPLQTIIVGDDEAASPGFALEVISELVNQFEAIESTKIRKFSRVKNGEHSIAFIAHPAKKHNPDQHVEMREEKNRSRPSANKPALVIEEVKPDYTLEDLVNKFKDAKGEVVFVEISYPRKSIRADIRLFVIQNCEQLFEKYLPNDGTVRRKNEQIAIQTKIMKYLMEFEQCCFESFGRHITEIPIEDQNVLFDIAAQNVSELQNVIPAL